MPFIINPMVNSYVVGSEMSLNVSVPEPPNIVIAVAAGQGCSATDGYDSCWTTYQINGIGQLTRLYSMLCDYNVQLFYMRDVPAGTRTLYFAGGGNRGRATLAHAVGGIVNGIKHHQGKNIASSTHALTHDNEANNLLLHYVGHFSSQDRLSGGYPGCTTMLDWFGSSIGLFACRRTASATDQTTGVYSSHSGVYMINYGIVLEELSGALFMIPPMSIGL